MENLGSMLQARIFRRGDSPILSKDVFEFRKQLFIDALGWRLTTTNGQETDEFDTDQTVYAGIYAGNTLAGSFRAIRADHPYLAESIFPDLAVTKPYPKSLAYWEISRFGLQRSPVGRSLAAPLYALMFHFALVRQARSLVAVTDLVHEKYLARHGISSRRYGPPRVYREEESEHQLVAGEIPIRTQNTALLQNLLSNLNGVSIHDETLVFRPSSMETRSSIVSL